MIAALSRKELVDLVMAATTDTIVDDERPELAAMRPNLLLEGCRSVRAFGHIGYPDPEAAALVIAGQVADAILDRLSLRGELAA